MLLNHSNENLIASTLSNHFRKYALRSTLVSSTFLARYASGQSFLKYKDVVVGPRALASGILSLSLGFRFKFRINFKIQHNRALRVAQLAQGQQGLFASPATLAASRVYNNV